MISDMSLAPSCGVLGRAYIDCSDAVVVGVAASAEEVHHVVDLRPPLLAGPIMSYLTCTTHRVPDFMPQTTNYPTGDKSSMTVEQQDQPTLSLK